MLQDKVIAIYCLVDDLLKEMNHNEHNDRIFTDGQVITTALVSAPYFRGNQTMALGYMRRPVFAEVIGKSGFTERLHRLKEVLIFILLRIGRVLKYTYYICLDIKLRACWPLVVSIKIWIDKTALKFG